METVVIALELLRRIPKGRTVTAPQLKRQLAGAGIERDVRTIERHLESLSGHFEIDRDETSKPYRYSWKASSKGISLPTLTGAGMSLADIGRTTVEATAASPPDELDVGLLCSGEEPTQ